MKNFFIFITVISSGFLYAQIPYCTGSPVTLATQNYPASPGSGDYHYMVGDSDQDGVTAIFRDRLKASVLTAVGDTSLYNEPGSEIYNTQAGASIANSNDKMSDSDTNKNPYTSTYWLRLEVTNAGNGNSGPCIQISELNVKVSVVEYIGGDNSSGAARKIGVCSSTGAADLPKIVNNLTELGNFFQNIITNQTGTVAHYYTTQKTDPKADYISTSDRIEPISGATHTFSSSDIVFPILKNADGVYRIIDGGVEIVDAIPSTNNATTLTVCDTDDDGFSTFDLTAQEANTSGASFTYHNSQSDALANTNSILNPNRYRNPTAYVDGQVFSSITYSGCSIVRQVDLSLGGLSAISSVEDLSSCATVDTPNQAEFDLTSRDISYFGVSPTNKTVNYYTSAADAIISRNVITPVNKYVAVLGSSSSTRIDLHGRVDNIITGCYKISPLTLIIVKPPTIDSSDLETCQSQGLSTGVFDFASRANEIRKSFSSSYTVQFIDHSSGTPNADVSNNNAYSAPNGRKINIEVLAASNTSQQCLFSKEMNLKVRPSPSVSNLLDYTSCENFRGSAQSNFDFTSITNQLIADESNTDKIKRVFYYETEADYDADRKIANPDAYVSGTKDIIYKIEGGYTNSSFRCSSKGDLGLTVRSLPKEVQATDYSLCASSSGGSRSFDLSTKRLEIVNADPALSTDRTITFYETLAEANKASTATPVNIATETSYSSSDASKNIYIRNEINSTGCFATSLFSIKVTSSLNPNKPSDFVLCKEKTNIGASIFDLRTKIPEISQASSNVIRFYTDQTEASIGSSNSPSRIFDSSGSSNPDNTSSYRGQDGQIIYVFIRDNSCQNTTSFTLRVRTRPSVNKSVGEIRCAGNASEAIFNLNSKLGSIIIASGPLGLGGIPSTTTVTFHEKLLDAENITTGAMPDNSIPNPDNYVSSSANIYARVYDSNSKCLNTTTIQLFRSSTPIVQRPVDNIVCEDLANSTRGTAVFDLSVSGNNMAIPSASSSSWTYTYYPSRNQAISGQDEITNITAFQSSSSTLTAIIGISSTCKAIQSFDLSVKKAPSTDITNMVVCEEKSVSGNPLGRGFFDLKSKLDLITSSYTNRSNYDVTIHLSSGEAFTGSNDISSNNSYSASDNDIFYVRSSDNTGSTLSCIFINDFSVTVNPIPDIASPTNLETCEDNIQKGTGIFNLTTNSDVVRRRGTSSELLQSRYPVRYYTSSASANEGSLTSVIQNTTSYRSPLISGTRNIYVRVEDITNTCFSVKQFNLKVFSSPILVTPPSFNDCDVNPGTNKTFDLTTRENIIRNGLTTSRYTLTWHTSSASADNNTGIIPTASSYQTQSNVSVFARVNDTGNTAGCYSIAQLNLKILSNPVLKSNIEIGEVCAPSVNIDPTYAQFDLSTLESESLITENPGAERLEFYETQCEALNSTATITNPPAIPCQDASGSTINPTYSKLPKNQQIIRTVAGTSTKTIFVRSIDRSNGSCSAVGQVVLKEAIMPPAAKTMTNLIACDDNVDWTNTPSSNINFSSKDQEALGSGVNLAEYNVTYHTNRRNAESGTSSLNKTSFRNTIRTTDIFVRVENKASKCFSISDFRVWVNGPVLNNIALLKSCSTTVNTNTAAFNLVATNNSALDRTDTSKPQVNLYRLIAHNYGVGSFSFEFFDVNSEASALAQLATNRLPLSYITGTKDIYVRVTESGTGPSGGACISAAPLKIEVDAIPQANKPNDIYTCDVESGQQAFFNLSQKTLEIIGTQSLNNISVSYHNFLPDAQATPALNLLPDGLNGRSNDYSPTSGSLTETVYVRVSSGNSSCFNTTDFEINRISPVNSVTPTEPFNNCDGRFNLVTDVSPTLIGSLNQSDHIVKYYLTERTAKRDSDQISTTGGGSVNTTSAYRVPNSQTLVARIEDITSGCFSIGRVDLINNGYSKPYLIPGVILEKCDDDTDEIVQFDLTEIETSISDLNTRQTFTYHETSPSPNTLAVVSPDFYRNISSPQDMFVRVTDNISACSSIGKFQLRVNPIPEIKNTSTDLGQCDLDTDLITLFDLSTAIPDFIDSNNPNDLTIAYYRDAVTAKTGGQGGKISSLYTNKVSGLETVVMSFTDNKNCVAVADLNLIVTQSEITERQAEVIEVCDDLLIDSDDENGVASFDITTKKRALDSKLVSSLDNEHFYYENENDALLRKNEISKVTEYRNENSPFNYSLYVRIEDKTTKKCLAVSKLLRLVVNPLPKQILKDTDLYCVGGVKEVEIGPEPRNGYQYLWSSGETSSKIKPKIENPYSVTITSDKGCQATSTQFNLRVSSVPSSITVIEKSFNINSQTGIIKVEAKSDGAGRYVYSIDDENIYKAKGEFDKLFSGKHLIHVKDLNGCGIQTKEFNIVGYTNFITPNGDGINDTWNIGIDENMINPNVIIYDRNSNPIATFDPSQTSWDGTFNGVPAPSNDYWFAVNYIDKKDYLAKVLKGHFTLKR